MLKKLSRWLRTRGAASPVVLADPEHPAARWINSATRVAQQRITMRYDGSRILLETTPQALGDLVGALDLALSEAPNDPDLLCARAEAHRFLGDAAAERRDLAAALQAAPGHPEAELLQRFGADWAGPLYLPPWSSSERVIHEVMARKRDEGEILQPISHSLQPGLAVVLVDPGDAFGGHLGRCDWRFTHSDTPHGPIAAHYTLLELDGRLNRLEGIVSPASDRDEASLPGRLLPRLAAARDCFVVVVETDGLVRHNECVRLPDATRSALRAASTALSGIRLSREEIAAATQWHIERFDMDQLEFEA